MRKKSLKKCLTTGLAVSFAMPTMLQAEEIVVQNAPAITQDVNELSTAPELNFTNLEQLQLQYSKDENLPEFVVKAIENSKANNPEQVYDKPVLTWEQTNATAVTQEWHTQLISEYSVNVHKHGVDNVVRFGNISSVGSIPLIETFDVWDRVNYNHQNFTELGEHLAVAQTVPFTGNIPLTPSNLMDGYYVTPAGSVVSSNPINLATKRLQFIPMFTLGDVETLEDGTWLGLNDIERQELTTALSKISNIMSPEEIANIEVMYAEVDYQYINSVGGNPCMEMMYEYFDEEAGEYLIKRNIIDWDIATADVKSRFISENYNGETSINAGFKDNFIMTTNREDGYYRYNRTANGTEGTLLLEIEQIEHMYNWYVNLDADGKVDFKIAIIKPTAGTWNDPWSYAYAYILNYVRQYPDFDYDTHYTDNNKVGHINMYPSINLRDMFYQARDEVALEKINGVNYKYVAEQPN
ncbi:MAG: hypothetical protein ATN36_01015 [Epulopiscium sp. Nele67-Bin005]|nr:MAG: hypothetical protein ATN36_01015 [Epulopiscium sp. Nele67-Bin005]